MDVSPLSAAARRLGSVLEPLTGQVYFSPECHRNYVALGFDPSPTTRDGLALPDGPSYYTSRGSVMGQVTGMVVASAFAVFNPDVIAPAVDAGWSKTDAVTICAARDDGAIAQLVRLIGERPEGIDRANELLARAVEPLRPEGRPLFAGMRSLAIPASPIGTMFRLGDALREYRGDSHTAAWIAAGLDATEICLVSELYWQLPPRTYSRSRAWTTAQFDAALERLQRIDMIDAAGTALTEHGFAVREEIERHTDAQLRGAVDALGDDAPELFRLLAPWGVQVRAGHGYGPSGPHDRPSTGTRSI